MDTAALGPDRHDLPMLVYLLTHEEVTKGELVTIFDLKKK